MNLSNKNILLISPEPWTHIFVSKHHYATNLVKRGNKVFFLNPPSNQEYCSETEHSNLYSVAYKGFIKGLRFLPKPIQKKMLKQEFVKLQTLCNTQFDIVWSFDNSVFFDFSVLPKEVYCISHIVDLNQDFNTKKAAETANLCIGVIPQLVLRLSTYNENSVLVSHGVQDFKNNYEVAKLPGNNKIKSLYTGNMEMPHIDWQLINQLVDQSPNVDFVFLGSKKNDNKAIKALSEKPNAYYLPAVSAQEVTHYLNSADVLLLAYKPAYYKEYATPHKMMEYLGSGKVIIATWTAEYEELHNNGLLSMSKRAEEYIQMFKETVSNLDNWNSKGKVRDRKHYAANNTYDKKIEKIEKIMATE